MGNKPEYTTKITHEQSNVIFLTGQVIHLNPTEYAKLKDFHSRTEKNYVKNYVTLTNYF